MSKYQMITRESLEAREKQLRRNDAKWSVIELSGYALLSVGFVWLCLVHWSAAVLAVLLALPMGKMWKLWAEWCRNEKAQADAQARDESFSDVNHEE